MSVPGKFIDIVPLSAGEAASLANIELADTGHSSALLTGAASLEGASSGDLTFVTSKALPDIGKPLRAAAVICLPECVSSIPEGIAVLISARPKDSFATVTAAMYPSSQLAAQFGPDENHAFISATATIEPGVKICAGAVIGESVSIGEGTVIGPNATIGQNCQIGRNCQIGAGVTVTHALIGNGVILNPGVRIGQDGFGYVPIRSGLQKIPHVGRVIIQDSVEIGANSSVDRGMLDDTVIGEGTKIDNLVQIGHNVRIGRNCVIAALCGLSGSVRLGDWVMVGGSVGLADHISIGDRAQIAARSGVMNDVPAGEKWGGTPAQPVKDFFREVSALRKLARDRKDSRP
jgi:UDP-3-O-[3-hydroxymyristoyl] glucosamine N-acyltransferase